MKKLDTYKEFTYTYYKSCNKLKIEYDRMCKKIEASGYILESNTWPIESGILLENDNTVIAGAFFNLTSRKKIILMQLIYVEEPYRKNGIYKHMHFLINNIGKEEGKTSIYSYIHVDNFLMQEYIAKNIGYVPIMNLVKKIIK